MHAIQDHPAADYSHLPLRVLQFGEGNFLRAFADWMIDKANEAGAFAGSIAVVKPRPGSLAAFRAQGNRYTVVARGLREGRAVREARLVTSIAQTVDPYEDFSAFLRLARCDTLVLVLSNTTEAGLALSPDDRPDAAPPASFPAKLTRLLFERYRHFQGAADKGLYCLPLELLPENGRKLEACVQSLIRRWALPEAFAAWVRDSCRFCDTLVDRIVSGFPADEAPALWQRLGYADQLLTVCEPYALWAVEDRGDIRRRLPLDAAGLPVRFVPDVAPLRERKTRLLNGAHTLLAAVGLTAGVQTVGGCMGNPAVSAFLERCLREEILPHTPGEPAENRLFQAAMLERFANPCLEHRLASISLNALSKWRARLLPTLEACAAEGALPDGILLAFAVQLHGLLFPPPGMETALSGEPAEAAAFFETWASALRDGAASWPAFAEAAAAQAAFWGTDLRRYPALSPTVAAHLSVLSRQGLPALLQPYLEVSK